MQERLSGEDSRGGRQVSTPRDSVGDNPFCLALGKKLYDQLVTQVYGRNGTQALFKHYEK